MALLVGIAILFASGALWLMGLRLFLRSDLSRRKKVAWTVFLLIAGFGIGLLLPLAELWSKFLVLVVILPALGLADVWLLRSGRSLSFWIRACGFEVCTVFGTATATRLLLDLMESAA